MLRCVARGALWLCEQYGRVILPTLLLLLSENRVLDHELVQVDDLHVVAVPAQPPDVWVHHGEISVVKRPQCGLESVLVCVGPLPAHEVLHGQLGSEADRAIRIVIRLRMLQIVASGVISGPEDGRESVAVDGACQSWVNSFHRSKTGMVC